MVSPTQLVMIGPQITPLYGVANVVLARTCPIMRLKGSGCFLISARPRQENVTQSCIWIAARRDAMHGREVVRCARQIGELSEASEEPTGTAEVTLLQYQGTMPDSPPPTHTHTNLADMQCMETRHGYLLCTEYRTHMSRHKSRSGTRVESVMSSPSCRLGPGRTVGRFDSIRNNLSGKVQCRPSLRRHSGCRRVVVRRGEGGGGAGPGRARKAGQPSLWPSTRSS